MITAKLGEIPEEGLRLQGATTRDIFELPETDPEARAGGPTRYDLLLTETGADLILAQGSLEAPFLLRCGACLEEFPHVIRWPDYAAEFERPASGILDLTERLREDLLLELPAYPRCDRDGEDPGRTCPGPGLASPEDGAAGEAGEGEPPTRGTAWDALEALRPGET